MKQWCSRPVTPTRSTGFFGSDARVRVGDRTENCGPEQAALNDVEDVCVSVTHLAPDLPAPRLELLRYRVGTRPPILAETVSNDIAAIHSVMQVASLNATAAPPSHAAGVPSTGDDFITPHGGTRVARMAGP